jgi:hypothetical protein
MMDSEELPQVTVGVAVKNGGTHCRSRFGGVEPEVTMVTGDDLGPSAVAWFRDCDARRRAHGTLGGALHPRHPSQPRTRTGERTDVWALTARAPVAPTP